MKTGNPAAVHVWLIWLKATQAVARTSLHVLEGTELGESDFRVLELLLHKGALPVNVIGPKVNLTPGSISVCVDRLFCKGLVSRAESATDRRVRLVELTPAGRSLIEPVFQRHSQVLDEIFGVLTDEERGQLEALLRKTGLSAAEVPAAETG